MYAHARAGLSSALLGFVVAVALHARAHLSGTAAWADVGVLASGTGERRGNGRLWLWLLALACHRPRPRRRLTQLGGTAFDQANRRPPSPAQLMQASMQASMQAYTHTAFGLIYIKDRRAALFFA